MMMALKKISKFTLKNDGGYVARGQVSYMDEDGNKVLSSSTGDILLGQTKEINPGELGVPRGSQISLYVFVVWGKDHEAPQTYIYDPDSPRVAKYVSAGTTLGNSLGLISDT
jgi:hypothetical protein